LVFKYFFPDCNIRIYLDHYMLEGFNKKWRWWINYINKTNW
jgi:hypothetical protein